MSKKPITVFWHRRDLRVEDNHGLYRALKENGNVVPLFIFDTTILSKLVDKSDQRVSFIHYHLSLLQKIYANAGGQVIVKVGNPVDVWKKLLLDFNVGAVVCNRDYEPYAINRDQQVFEVLNNKGISFKGYKDQVIFEKNEIIKDDGNPYTVFTPYSKKWKATLQPFMYDSFPSEKSLDSLCKDIPSQKIPSLNEIGFSPTQKPFPSSIPDKKIIQHYHLQRDIPSVNGTTRMSAHLRFGTISVRSLTRLAHATNETYLNELIWREFYQMILFHFPETVERSFKPAYDRIEWVNDEKQFEKWCEGKTGYPLVDAGMRELNATGHMHNRVRMVVASFLVKHLLIDWRWGEAYFKEKLLDYECASNIGGWQWAAGCGTDAAPYFRVFNPSSQQVKFDPEFTYIRQWVPEYGTTKYPSPMIEHAFARDRILRIFKKALQ